MKQAKSDPRKIEIHWNQNDDPYLPTVTIHEGGSMRICCGGLCIEKPVRVWHDSEKEISKWKELCEELLNKIVDYHLSCKQSHSGCYVFKLIERAERELGK